MKNGILVGRFNRRLVNIENKNASAPTTRKGRERRSREHLYDGRARVRFAPQAQPHDTYIKIFGRFGPVESIYKLNRAIFRKNYIEIIINAFCSPLKKKGDKITPPPLIYRGGGKIFPLILINNKKVITLNSFLF